MSAYKAAREAGYSHNTAWNAHKNIEKHCNFEQELIKAGLTDDLLAEHAQDGLNAMKVISAVIVNQKNRPTSLADGELFDANEKTNDFIDVPDWTSRHKYFETILRLQGKIKDKTLIDQSQHHTLILQVEKENDDKIKTAREAVASI